MSKNQLNRNWLHVRVLTTCVVTLALFSVSTLYVSPEDSQRPDPPARQINLGVMGDSYSDEYRADDNRAGSSYDGRYAATTLNWLELLVKYRGVNAGRWGTWGGSRRTGYEYNWALSGATAADVIRSGQDTGLAEQVREGLITDVILHVGANDFAIWNGTFATVYNGPAGGGLDDAQVQQKVDEIILNITTAVNTIRAAGNVHLMVSNLLDRGQSPYFQRFFPDPTKRQRVTRAVMAVNAGIETMAKSRGVYVIDQYGTSVHNRMLSRIDSEGNLNVDGVLITLIQDDDEPHHAILGDHDHIGTVASGYAANYMFIQGLNSFGGGITPFTEREILANAGIQPLSP